MPTMVHDAAAAGFRQRAETYQQARPAYHPALIDRVLHRYGGGLVADIGAGTGISTAQLVDAGLDVVAVEPVAEMRALLASRLADVRILAGAAEDLPLDDAAVACVVAAQAFHWFDHAAALDEIHRVLRPAGFLVTVWNVREESAGWVAGYNRIQERYAGDTPRYRTMLWRTAIDADARLEPVEEWSVGNPMRTTVDGVVGRMLSTSFIAALPAAEQERVAQETREIVEPYGPALEFPYRSELQAWRKR